MAWVKIPAHVELRGCHDHPLHLLLCLPPRGGGAEGGEMKTEGNLGVLCLFAPRRHKRAGGGQGWFASAFSMRESDPLPRMQRLMNPKFRIWDLHCHLSGVPGLTPEERLGQLLR